MPEKNQSVEDAKKKITAEIKGLAKRTKKTLEKAKELRDEKQEAEKQKEKKKVVDLQKELKKLEEQYLKETTSVCSQLQKGLKDLQIPARDERGFAKWYANMVDKESGIDLGKDVKLWGDIDMSKKEFKLTLKGKF